MRVNHRCLHVAVAEKLLNGSNIGPTLKQVGGKAMAKGMAASWFTDSCSSDCRAYGALDHRRIKMMAPPAPQSPYYANASLAGTPIANSIRGMPRCIYAPVQLEVELAPTLLRDLGDATF